MNVIQSIDPAFMLMCCCVLLCTHLWDPVPHFRRHPFSDYGLASVCVCVCSDFNCPSSLLDTAMAWLQQLAHTHTHTHFQVQGLEKDVSDTQTHRHLRVHNLKRGVSENEAPGPVGAYTTTHNNTPTPMPDHCSKLRTSTYGEECSCCREDSGS